MLKPKTGIILLVLMTLAAALFFSTFFQPRAEPLLEFKETRPYFGAYFTIHCRYDKKVIDIQKVTNECWRKLDVIQLNMNSESPMGYLGLINRSVPNAGVQVSDDLYHILQDAIGYSKTTRGAFDITVRPLVQLWKEAASKNILPTQAELDAALQRTGAEYIRLENNNTVVLTKPGMKLDLNAIAPAFAVDLVGGILSRNGIAHFMVDGSGEISCKGDQSGQRGWRVGVHDPADKKGAGVRDILLLENSAVSTSGNYERFYTIQGQEYSHILDPRTGRPASGVISATVIAPTAEVANSFSTALCVLGGEKGIALVQAVKNSEAFILEKRGGKAVSFETPGYHKLRASK